MASNDTTDDDVRDATPPAAAATRSTTISITIALLVLLVASTLVILLSPLASTDGGAEPVERAVGIAGFNNRLDAFRGWAKLVLMKLRRPSESRYDATSPSSVKESAEKSLEMGKATVEVTAAGAAGAAGAAVKEVERAVSSPRQSSDEEL